MQRNLREKAGPAKTAAAANQRLQRNLFVREWHDAEHLLEQGKIAAALAWFARAARERPTDFAVQTRLLAILTEHNFAFPTGRPVIHGAPGRRAALTADGRQLVTASADNRGPIWTLDSEAAPLLLPDVFANPAVAVAAPGNRVRVDDSESVSLWSLNGTRLKSVAVSNHFIHPIPMSPDGRYAALNCGAEGAQLWDATELRPAGRPVPAQNLQGGSPDGRWALSAAAGGTVRVWPLLLAPMPAPAWLPELAETVAARRL